MVAPAICSRLALACARRQEPMVPIDAPLPATCAWRLAQPDYTSAKGSLRMDSDLRLRPENCVKTLCLDTLPRPWDAFDAYLFDVDGTLINCRDAVHYFAFCAALRFLSGRDLNLDGVIAHGNTDIGILRDALTLAGIPDARWRLRLAEACERMCAHVHEHRNELRAEVLPGAREVLVHLRARGAFIGVATGNLRGIGTAKLQSCGLFDLFHFHGFSDGFECRSDVYRSALEKARSAAGRHATICAIGDTPADIRAAREHGISVIAVGTGIHPLPQLAAEQPDLCVSSLRELVS
jgi:phosphoglycolate phosphatase